MMVAGVIENQLHPSSRMAADRAQIPQKQEEALGIEFLGPMEHKLAISQPYRSKVANGFAGRMVIDNRVFRFRWNPHATP